jgi:hypothetical protein
VVPPLFTSHCSLPLAPLKTYGILLCSSRIPCFAIATLCHRADPDLSPLMCSQSAIGNKKNRPRAASICYCPLYKFAKAVATLHRVHRIWKKERKLSPHVAYSSVVQQLTGLPRKHTRLAICSVLLIMSWFGPSCTDQRAHTQLLHDLYHNFSNIHSWFSKMAIHSLPALNSRV